MSRYLKHFHTSKANLEALYVKCLHKSYIGSQKHRWHSSTWREFSDHLTACRACQPPVPPLEVKLILISNALMTERGFNDKQSKTTLLPVWPLLLWLHWYNMGISLNLNITAHCSIITFHFFMVKVHQQMQIPQTKKMHHPHKKWQQKLLTSSKISVHIHIRRQLSFIPLTM